MGDSFVEGIGLDYAETFISNMTGELRLPGLLADHPRAYSVSRTPLCTGFRVKYPRMGMTAA